MADPSVPAWVPFAAHGQVTAGETTAYCQVVSLSTDGVVVLPAMKGGPGLSLALEVQLPDHPAPLVLPGVVVREGEYHGHYAWQIQFVHLPPESAQALAAILGVSPPPPAEEPSLSAAAAAKRSPTRPVLDLTPAPDLEDVAPAAFDEEEALAMQLDEERDLLSEIPESEMLVDRRLDRIYKAALRDLDTDGKKGKKKKGWFK
jgi:hypothetical protein